VSTTRAAIDRILEKLAPLDVTAKPMFGEYGLYHRGRNFALVCDGTLFVKVTDAGAGLAGRVATAPPYPGAKPAFRISTAKLSDRVWITALVEATSGALPAPAPRRARRS